MQKKRVCRLLPKAKLPKNIFVSSDMKEVLQDCELLLIAVPSDKVETTLKNAAPSLQKQPVILCSKGFSSGLRLLSEVAEQEVSGKVYCLYGPTHAEEVCHGIFSGIVLAGGKGKEKLKDEIKSDTLRVDLSDDIIGVQVAAALKNILAVFIGMLDGAGYGDNTKAYVLTKGLQEIKDVGVAWGAKEKTFYGLAGIGDMIVTCSSTHSRNFCTGREVGKGRKLDEVLSDMKMVAEGVTTTKVLPGLKKKLNLDLPLLMGVYRVLFKGKKVKEILVGI